jgi:hypothetical protein
MSRKLFRMFFHPPEDREQFNRWSSSLGLLLDGSDFSLEGVFEAVSEVSNFLDYFRTLMHARRAAPKMTCCRRC